ncbi:MAG: type II secretion system protein GspG [Spirochaetota bacterium]
MEQTSLQKIFRIIAKVFAFVFVSIFILGLLLFIYVKFFFGVGNVYYRSPSLKLKKKFYELRLHLERYFVRNGDYPSEEQGILALIEKPIVGEIPKNYKPIIKTKASIIDPWGTLYILRFNEDGEPEIWTLGKDKKTGGPGKAKDFNIGDFNSYPKTFKSVYD